MTVRKLLRMPNGMKSVQVSEVPVPTGNYGPKLARTV
jgi:hypothetical protein